MESSRVTALGACLIVVQSLAALAAVAGNAAGQSFPNKPIRLVVPVPAGAGADFVARTYAQRLGAAFGQQVVIDNRGGAAGIIAMETEYWCPHTRRPLSSGGSTRRS